MRKKTIILFCAMMTASLLLSATGCDAMETCFAPAGVQVEKEVRIDTGASNKAEARNEAADPTEKEVKGAGDTEEPDSPDADPGIKLKQDDPLLSSKFVQKAKETDDLPDPLNPIIDPTVEQNPEDPDGFDLWPEIEPKPVEPDTPFIEPQIEPYPGYRGDGEGNSIALCGEVNMLKFHLTTTGASGSKLEQGYYIRETGDKDYPYMLVVYTGEYPTGGYYSYISDLFYASENFMITVTTIAPPADASVTQAIIYPYCGILLSKLPEKIDVINAAVIDPTSDSNSGLYKEILPDEIPADVTPIDVFDAEYYE